MDSKSEITRNNAEELAWVFLETGNCSQVMAEVSAMVAPFVGVQVTESENGGLWGRITQEMIDTAVRAVIEIRLRNAFSSLPETTIAQMADRTLATTGPGSISGRVMIAAMAFLTASNGDKLVGLSFC